MSQNSKIGKTTDPSIHSLANFVRNTFSVAVFPVVALSLVLTMVSASQAQVPERNEYYGNWEPPQQTATSNAAVGTLAPQPITRENFRSFFPPSQKNQVNNQLRPRNDSMATNNVPQASFQPLPPQKHVPAQARPLQPILNSNGSAGMPNGQFASQSDFQPARMARLPDFPNPMTRDRRAADSQNGIVRQANFETLANNAVSTSDFSMPQRDPNTALMESSLPSTDFSTTANAGSPGVMGWLKKKTSGWFSSSEVNSGEETSAAKSGWQQKVSGLFGGLSDQTKKMVGSLALVLGGYFAFVSVMRKINPRGNQGIPAEVVEVIGNAPFGPRKNLQLVRLGSKLLLLMNGPEGTHPVGEITDANEVEYLVSLCTGKRSRASKTIVSAVERLRGAAASNTTASTAVNTGASATAIAEVLRALENGKTSTVFEA